MISSLLFMGFLTLVIVLLIILVYGLNHFFGASDQVVYSAFVQSMILFWLLLISIYLKKEKLFAVMGPDMQSLVWALFFNVFLIIWLIHFICFFRKPKRIRRIIIISTAIISSILAVVFTLFVAHAIKDPDQIKTITRFFKFTWRYGAMVIVPISFVSVIYFRKKIRKRMKRLGTLF